MCGILGYIGKKRNENFSVALDTLRNRGPDNIETKLFLKDKFIELGHSRLSIIDLDKRSNQPFGSDNCSLIYNGEIYNFLEIKKILVEKGHVFHTRSDTEVLYCVIKNKYFDLLDRFEGIFAFAFLDQNKGKVFFGRDRLGIKPLYYYSSNNEFIFSSEIKAIKKIKENILVDNTVLTEFFLNGFIHEPKTGFKDINKIEMGALFELDIKTLELDLKYEFKNKFENDDESLEKKIRYSVNEQLISDVDLCVLFSGGIDSTLLAIESKNSPLLTGKHKSEDVKSSGISEDAKYAQIISKKLNRKLDYLHFQLPKEFEESLNQVIDGNEELCSDITFLITSEICKEARKKGFKVVLSGMGADELFQGYPRYYIIKYHYIFRIFLPLIRILKPIFKIMPAFNKKIDRLINSLENKSFAKSYLSLVSNFSFQEIKSILKSSNLENYFKEYDSRVVDNSNFLEKALESDKTGFLSHNLMVSDKASMKQSVELRVPLLSNRLLKHSLKNKKNISLFGNQKLELKKQLINYLPESIFRRSKAGFNPPMDNWISSFGKKGFLKILNESKAYRKYMDKKFIIKIINQHFDKKSNNTFKLWQIFYLIMWLEKNGA